jgi:hypothetical protein
MSGLIGRLFHEFAVTVSLAILVSGVISLTLTPMLCSRFLRAEADSPKPGKFSRACERGYQWLLGHYETGLKWVLRHQRFTLAVTLLTMAATVWLTPSCRKDFFRNKTPASSWARPGIAGHFIRRDGALRKSRGHASPSGGGHVGSFIGADRAAPRSTTGAC